MTKEKENALATSINVLWVVESNFIKGNGIKAHEHGYYHLFMAREGSARVTVGARDYTLSDGDFFIAKPGTTHHMHDVDIPILHCYEVKFVSMSPQVSKLLDTLPDFFPSDSFTREIIKGIVAEGARGEVSSPKFAGDYMLVLVEYLHRHYGARESASASILDTTGYSELSRKVVSYLEEHFMEKLLLQEVADAVGLNKNYMCSAFKKDTGMTVGTCLTVIQIRKAAELISFSDLNLNQVASATGFVNLSHFNRIFKKVVGIPPGHYRRMFSGDILTMQDYKGISDETLQTILDQNGFIASVLGRKCLSIQGILDQIQEENDELRAN